MKLALIPPNCSHTSILDGSINLILPWQLRDLPSDFIQRALKTYTILDNGAAEGTTAGLNELSVLIQKCIDLGSAPHELVLPDELGNCDATRGMVLAAKDLGPLQDLRIDYGIKFMAVAQGQSLAEIMSCINLFTELSYVDVIGLPRIMNQTFGQHSRLRMAESLAKTDSYPKPIHCLGSFYYYPTEARDLKWLPNIRSMDTSLPWVYGIKGRYIDRVIRGDIDRPSNYFQYELNTNQRSVSERNVWSLIRWAQTRRS
jgi:hypothetical protein